MFVLVAQLRNTPAGLPGNTANRAGVGEVSAPIGQVAKYEWLWTPGPLHFALELRMAGNFAKTCRAPLK